MTVYDRIKNALPVAASGLSSYVLKLTIDADWSWGWRLSAVSGVIVSVGLLNDLVVRRRDELRRKEEAESKNKARLRLYFDGIVDCANAGQRPLDPKGALGIRVNLMLPYRGTTRKHRLAYQLPGKDYVDEGIWLMMYACSGNSLGRASKSLRWEIGQGCVGKLWACRSSEISVDKVSPETAADQFSMTPSQIEATSDTKAIVSVVLSSGVGNAYARRGVLNVSSSEPAAYSAWAYRGRPRPEIVEFMRDAVSNIVEIEDLLPKA